ncbi:Transcription factor GRAS [Dillenia turbinata]|uniref:Transcription factor GRAS n=1 Tax=Dillenia turbinata TaxID=194707 RepID=A0AAN8VQ59_9MAGN
MDPIFDEYSDSMNNITIGETFFADFHHSPNLPYGLDFKDDDDNNNILGHNFMVPPDPDPFSSLSSLSPEGSSSDDGDSDTTLKFISQILLEEEDLADKPSMFYDPLALQATEKSLSDALVDKFPPPSNQAPLYVTDSPDEKFSPNFSDYSTNSYSSTSTSITSSIDPIYVGDVEEFNPGYAESQAVDHGFQAASQWPLSFSTNGYVDSSMTTHFVSQVFGEDQSILQMQYRRGLEEANKFLQSSSTFIVDLEKNGGPKESRESTVTNTNVVIKKEKDEREHSPNGSRGRKNHEREEDYDLEFMRSNKQSAVYEEETEQLADMFEKLLGCTDWKYGAKCELDHDLQQNGAMQDAQANGVNGGANRVKKPSGSRNEVADLRTLLISCAQSVAADDRRTANEQLKQIRKYSSPTGDGSQRLAHYFANGIEARMGGIGTQTYTALLGKKRPAAAMLKSYQTHLAACPFKKMAYFYANHNIAKVADKATTLHIIDFGILYGIQWPILIQYLSTRPGGPPKVRITGIDIPVPGFRPAELVEETGRRLAKCCERFKVPFEYNAIAKAWETIQIEDLNIRSDEVVAVNTLCRFKNLLDESVMVENPRDTVLKLIRKINPSVFTHCIINGSYSAPFFVTRFREALFHYSAMYDMLDTTLPTENEDRMMYEKEFCGREIMNVIACEGVERVERPETYKQWQIRITRAGFKQLPLDKEKMKKFTVKVLPGYHKDFVIDVDGHWMLQGWKGRILYANSCWVPA